MSFFPPLRYFLRPALLLLVVTLPARATDIDTIQARLFTQLTASVPSVATIQGYQSSLQSSGQWADITYSDHSQTNWIPQNHLTRLQAMAQGYAKPGTILYHDAALKASILSAYDVWVGFSASVVYSSNWWYQDIGSAQAVGNIMVLMKDDLTSAQLTKGAAKIIADPDKVTGLNAVDEATAKICRGIAQNDSATITAGFASIGKVIFISTGDGIQRDGTFYQHGNQLYNQGYGSGYISEVMTWSVLGAGTSFGITTAQQNILVDYILDGSQQMIRGEAFDYTAFGRGVSRNSPSSAGDGLLAPAANALLLTTYRAAELNALVTRQTNSRTNHTADPALALIGHKHFWRGDLTTHQRSAYYTSVKISSTRTYQPESGNGEGLKNLYLGDGVAQIMRTGNEYDDIMPVWDWRRLPGTTVEQDTRSLLPANSLGTATDWGTYGTSTFAGGVSDGTYGATAFNYSRYHVAAKKSWFHFDNEFAALGAAVTTTGATANTYTTLNQCLLNGTVTYETSSGTTTLAAGSSVTPAGLKWVHHDGVGYFFPTPVSTATIQSLSQSGTWLSLNTGGSSTTLTKGVFSLHLTQAKAVTGGTYNYIVVPGIAVGDMDAYLAANPIVTLRNDATAQAVRNTAADVSQAAFYAAGSITLETGRTLAANDKAAIQLRHQTNSLQLTAASPEARTMTPQFTLSGVKLSDAAGGGTWFDAFGSAVATTALPGGDLAGSSIGYTLSTDDAVAPTVAMVNSTGSAAVGHAVSAPVALPGNTTFQTDANSTLGLGGIVSGSYGITKTGPGILNLSGANTYTGATTASGGILNVSGDQTASTGSWTIGGSLVSTDATASFAAGSKVAFATGTTFTVNQAASNAASAYLNVAGSVTGDGTLNVGRGAAVVLASGAAWTQGGPMSVGLSSGTGYSSTLTVNSGGAFAYTGASAISVKPSSGAGGTASINVAGGTFTTAAGFTNPVISSTGSANLNLTAAGVLKLSADVPNLIATSGSPFNLQIGTGGGSIHTNGFSTTVATPVIGAGAFSKTGEGSLTLSGANTFSGGLTVAANGGTLVATSPAALGTGTISIPKGANQTGTLALRFTGTNTVANAFAGFASTTFAGDATPACIENLSGETTISGNLTVTGLGGNGIYLRASGGTLAIAGTMTHTVGSIRSLGLGGVADGIISGNILTGNGGFPLTKDGTGTWTLTGTNTYTGGTSIANGTLRIGSGGTSGTLGPDAVSNNGVLKIQRSNAITIANAISGSGSLVQSGTGTTTLTGALTYSGTTRVEAGTLQLNAASLPNATPVEIAPGAKLTLSFSGTDTVRSLTLGGQLQLAGTWGAVGSGAQHETALISGTGMLLATTGLDPYLAWIATQAVPFPADQAMTADPDGDGLSNLMEYALGLDPAIRDVLPAATLADGLIKLRYSLNTAATDLTVTPEWSSDLVTWHAEGITLTNAGDIGTRRQMEATVPLGTDGRKFLRLHVVK